MSCYILLTIKKIALLILVTQVTQGKVARMSQNILTLTSMLSGKFSNSKQVAREQSLGYDDTEDHDVIKVVWKHVEIPSFATALTMYHEEIDENRVFRRQIWVFSEEDKIINIQPLNITGFLTNSPDEQQDFSKLSLEPFKTQCEILFVPVEPEVYVGTIPDCTREMGGIQQLPYYGFTVSCSTVNALVYFENSREAVSKLPYTFKNKERYQLPLSLKSTVEGFKAPCNCI